MPESQLQQARESEEDAVIRIAGYRGRPYYDDSHLAGPAVYPDCLENMHRHTIRHRPMCVYIPEGIRAVVASTGTFLGPGTLSVLPTEILATVFLMTDMKTCLRLRQVNRFCRAIISNTVEYRVVVTHAVNMLASGLKMGFTVWHSFADVYRCMCTFLCANCGKVSHYVFLFDLERVCSHCLHRYLRYKIVTLASFAKASKRSRTTLARRVRVLSMMPHHSDRRRAIISYNEASQVVPNVDPGEGLGHFNIRPIWRMAACADLIFYDRTKRTGQGSLYCKGCVFRTEADCWLSMTLGYDMSDPAVRAAYSRGRVAYLPADFVAHFRDCEEAQKLWDEYHKGITRFWPNKLFRGI
jgi:hypothetical protein